MTAEVFVFRPNPSLGDIVHAIESPRGAVAVAQITAEYSSLAELIAHTHPSPDGSSTIIGLPAEQTKIVLHNLSEGQIRADARQLGHLLFG